MLTGIGHVLGDFSNEVQRLEQFEVADHCGALADTFSTLEGEWTAFGLLGPVKPFAIERHPHDTAKP